MFEIHPDPDIEGRHDMSVGQWVVYLVQCSDDSLYCGVTNDMDSRLAAHNAGKGAKYTKSRRPVVLVGVSEGMPKSDAFKLEYWIKRLPAHKKTAKLARARDESA